MCRVGWRYIKGLKHFDRKASCSGHSRRERWRERWVGSSECCPWTIPWKCPISKRIKCETKISMFGRDLKPWRVDKIHLIRSTKEGVERSRMPCLGP